MSLLRGEHHALVVRGITKETCELFNYSIGDLNGRPCQIANYTDAKGTVVAQKIRFENKDFLFLGETKKAVLFGQNLWRDGGRMVVITEGEIDALSVSQVQGNKWPVGSIPTGAKGAVKALAGQLEVLEKFDKVILMFDMDDPGQEAALECAALFTPGKAHIAHLPMKDANEMLLAERAPELIDAIWGAKAYRPDGILAIDDILAEIEKPVVIGKPWCFPTLTKYTYGRRPGEVYTFGAGTGIGKTDLMTQQIQYDTEVLGEKVGVIYLEQKPSETGKRIAGKIAKCRFHVPDAGWTMEGLKNALLKLLGKVFFYDSWGETEWDQVKGKIRFMAISMGVRHFFLDHLTAMADTANEKESLEQLMKELAGITNELGLVMHLVSHLATPEGKPHEEGGRVMIRHFKGSRSIGFWSHFMFGMERDQQDENERRRRITLLRCLKDRYTGQATGKVIGLDYDAATGMLSEVPAEEISDLFKDETASTGGGTGGGKRTYQF